MHFTRQQQLLRQSMVSIIGHNVLSDTSSSRPPNKSAQVKHEFLVWTILRWIISKLEESASFFPGKRAYNVSNVADQIAQQHFDVRQCYARGGVHRGFSAHYLTQQQEMLLSALWYYSNHLSALWYYSNHLSALWYYSNHPQQAKRRDALMPRINGCGFTPHTCRQLTHLMFTFLLSTKQLILADSPALHQAYLKLHQLINLLLAAECLGIPMHSSSCQGTVCDEFLERIWYIGLLN